MRTDVARADLIRLTKRAQVNRALAFRARLVLACVGVTDTAVARRYRTTNATVGKWRGRFVDRRLEGSTTSRAWARRGRSPMRRSRR